MSGLTGADEALGAEKAAEQEKLPDPAADSSDDDWRERRDAGAMARKTLGKEAEQEAVPAPVASCREQRRRERKEARRRRNEEREEASRRREEDRRQRQQAREKVQDEKLRTRQEKKDRRTLVRQERSREVKTLWHTVEFVMLVTFIALAIDQAGLYGFLFVWLFIAAAAASVVLMLVGVIRALAGKRTGIILLAGGVGIIGSIVWFLFLASSRGLGIF